MDAEVTAVAIVANDLVTADLFRRVCVVCPSLSMRSRPRSAYVREALVWNRGVREVTGIHFDPRLGASVLPARGQVTPQRNLPPGSDKGSVRARRESRSSG